MKSKMIAHALGIDPGLTARNLPHMEGLVQFHGGSTAISLELMSFHEIISAVSVDFSIMILTSLAPIFPTHCLQLDS